MLKELKHLPRALGLVWRASRGWTAAWGVLLLFQGLVPAATVGLSRVLVDTLVADLAKGGGWAAARPSLLLIGAMAGLLLLGEFLRLAANFVRGAQADRLRDHIAALIQSRAAAADLAFYEDPDSYDRLHRAREEGPYRPITLLESLGNLAQDAITLAAMAVVLVPFGAWLPAALLASTLPALAVVLFAARRQHRWQHEATPEERRSWYLDWLLTARETAPEIRLFGLAPHFQSLHADLRARLRTQRLRLTRSQALAELAAAAFAAATAAAAFIWIVGRAFHGAFTLGVVALFTQAFLHGQRLARSLLENAGRIYANSLFLGNLFEFLDLEPRMKEPTAPKALPETLSKGITFRGVTFRYPGSERPALRNLNLDIAAGSVVALVGLNGAGKSTVLKLLCRLYEVSEGTIALDGVGLGEVPARELRKRLSVLFQGPVHYDLTAGGNIAIGDIERKPSEAEVKEAARKAGAEEVIAKLPRGYENVLGKQFPGGTDLSGGEWQRIALARALVRKAPILLLDEPTSAMDAWAEAEWLKEFRAMTEGRTVVVITHRFTTALRADVIHVMEEGAIVESGTHEELLARNGKYAASWKAQVGAA